MGKISAIKKKNIKGGKMSKGKKTSNKRVTKARRRLALMKKVKQKNEAAAKGSKIKPDEIGAGDVLDMLDKEELAFIQSKDRIRHPEALVRNPSKGKKRNRPDDDEKLEEMYEMETVKRTESEKKIRPLLPIKTSRGLEMQFTEENMISEMEEQVAHSSGTSLSSSNGEEFIKPGQEITPEILRLRRKMILSDYNIRIGSLCALFLEDPENRMKNLDSVLAMLANPDASVPISVPKLCAVSLQAVFEDVLPSYPIKHTNPEGVKLKAQTRELQSFETGLLSRYKTYLQRLEKIINKYLPRKRKYLHLVSEAEFGFALVALRCCGHMLCSHPYFNMATNLMSFMVPLLNNWDEKVRDIVSVAIKNVFTIDKRGEFSLEIVKRINVLTKARYGPNKTNLIRRDLLDVLLALRIKEADVLKEKKEEMVPTKNMTFEQRKMLSKRQRKKAKEMVQLEKELLEASAEENKARKSHFLTETTKVVFAIYFRILKYDEINETLLSAVLEGLKKFAHVISIEYFDDLLMHLNRIQQRKDLSRQHILYCVRTVLSVLDGHGSVLTLDPTGFHKSLYNHLMALNSETDTKTVFLALECINLINKRKLPGPRAAAFVKRIASIALQLDHPEGMECLNELKKLIRIQTSTLALLDSEGSIASGVYLPELSDPDHCMAHTSSLWELSLLSRHYHPRVRETAQAITALCAKEATDSRRQRR